MRSAGEVTGGGVLQWTAATGAAGATYPAAEVARTRPSCCTPPPCARMTLAPGRIANRITRHRDHMVSCLAKCGRRPWCALPRARGQLRGKRLLICAHSGSMYTPTPPPKLRARGAQEMRCTPGLITGDDANATAAMFRAPFVVLRPLHLTASPAATAIHSHPVPIHTPAPDLDMGPGLFGHLLHHLVQPLPRLGVSLVLSQRSRAQGGDCFRCRASHWEEGEVASWTNIPGTMVWSTTSSKSLPHADDGRN